MKEFIRSLSDLLTDFPPLFVTIFVSALGTLCAVIIGILNEKQTHRKRSAWESLGRFVVGWLAGCFIGPLVAPAFQAMVKISESAVTFIAGASGYAFVEKVILKRAETMGEPPAKPPTTTTNDHESN